MSFLCEADTFWWDHLDVPKQTTNRELEAQLNMKDEKIVKVSMTPQFSFNKSSESSECKMFFVHFTTAKSEEI